MRRSLEGEAASDDEPGQQQRGRKPQAERHEADGADAGDRRDGRQDERLDRDARARRRWPAASRRRGPGGCRAASAPSRKIATYQTVGGSTRRDSPTTTTAAMVRSRRAARSGDRRRAVIGGMVRAAGPPCGFARAGWRRRAAPRRSDARRLARDPGQEVGPGARVEHVVRGHPRPARLADAPVEVRELAGLVGVRVDRQQAARARPRGGRARRPGRAGAASRSSRAPCRSGPPRA